MKLKSYLRGIGAGLIVAALVMGVSAPKTAKAEPEKNKTLLEEVADSNIDVSHKDELIAVEASEKIPVFSVSGADAEIPEHPDPLLPKDTDSELEEEKQASTESEPVTEVVAEPEKEQESAEIAEVTPPKIDPLPEGETGFTKEGDVVEIMVVGGDSSVSVARRLYEAGLVESAVEFDKYLCENGYDRRICTGKHEMPCNADFKELAEILCSKQ